MKRLPERVRRRLVPQSGCLVWQGYRNHAGYGITKFQRVTWRVHRLVWVHAYGAIPHGLCVLHRCDNPPCGDHQHLFLGTPGDNARDRDRKGRSAHKLSLEEAVAIRECRGSGLTQKQVAVSFGITQSVISEIWSGKAWKRAHAVKERAGI